MDTYPPGEPRQSRGVSTIDAARCARTQRPSLTVSVSRSLCVMPRCCTPSIYPAKCLSRAALLVWNLAERMQLPVRSDLELHRADAGGTAGLIFADRPLVLNRDGLIRGRQHSYVGLRVRSGCTQRGVVVEEHQLLGSRLAGDGRDDLHPVQAAFLGMSTRDLDPE